MRAAGNFFTGPGKPTGPRRMGSVARLLFLCFFFSGASALVYEVVWLRWLVHLFGATTLAVSTILTAFMGGLALGSWLCGRWAPALARSEEHTSELQSRLHPVC